MAVDIGLDVDHPAAAADDDIVDRPAGIDFLVAANHAGGQGRADFDLVLVVEQYPQGGFPIGPFHECEEPDLAEVDSQQGGVRVRIGRAHHQSVAAEHDDGIDLMSCVG